MAAAPWRFVEREESQQVDALLNRGGRVVLHGLRGVGKSVLAAHMAMRRAAQYDVVWWLEAASEAGVRSGLLSLARRLGWIQGEGREDAVLAQVAANLRDTDLRILLVLDNAADARSLKPSFLGAARADFLVTSNSPAWRSFAEVVPIRAWDVDTGARFLADRSGRKTEESAARDLSTALGGLPLALEQAGAYCEHLGVDLSAYLQRFNAQPIRLLDDDDHADPAYRDPGLTVAKTFALAIEAAMSAHPAAEAIIRRAARLAEAPVPLALVAASVDRIDEDLHSALAGDGLDRAIAALTAVALVELEPIVDAPKVFGDDRALRLHRLVRLVVEARCPPHETSAICADLFMALKRFYPRDVDDDVSTWPLARLLDPHLSALVAVADTAPRDVATEVSWLIDRLAAFRHLAQGDYEGALALHETAVAFDEANFGALSVELAADFNNMAELKRGMNRPREAEALYDRAAAIYGREPEHYASRLANIANNRGEALRATGRDDLAEPLYRQAISHEEGVPEADFASLAKYYGNLAIALVAMRRLDEALPEIRHALVLGTRVFGKYSLSVADDLNTFADVLRGAGEEGRAEKIYRIALKIAKRCLPANHPNFVAHFSNLAEHLRATNRPAEAETLLLEALAVAAHKKLAGDIATAVTLQRLAQTRRNAGDPIAAAALQRDALKEFFLFAKTNGAVHPRTDDAIKVYIDLAVYGLGKSEADAQADVVAVAAELDLPLRF